MSGKTRTRHLDALMMMMKGTHLGGTVSCWGGSITSLASPLSALAPLCASGGLFFLRLRSPLPSPPRPPIRFSGDDSGDASLPPRDFFALGVVRLLTLRSVPPLLAVSSGGELSDVSDSPLNGGMASSYFDRMKV